MAKKRVRKSSTSPNKRRRKSQEIVSLLPSERKNVKQSSPNPDAFFVGDPLPASEAQATWPFRYSNPDGSSENAPLKAKFHYREGSVDGVVYQLNDTAYVKAEDGKPDYIARIVEFFETSDNEPYFTAQWFYRAEDTVIKNHSGLVDNMRVFISDVKDDNPLDCILRKVNIAQVLPNVDLAEKRKEIPSCDLYYDMKYTVPYLTFSNIDNENVKIESENNAEKSDWSLLDLYSGCGAMSTGLCFGASISGIKLVTRWAVDMNKYACESLKLNHPETQVRNEAAEDFLNLLKEWEKLCNEFIFKPLESAASDEEADDEEPETQSDSEEFEVERFISVCYGDPNEQKKPGLYFKVQWKGYDSNYDTWEPIEGVSECKDAMRDFVTKGYKEKLLPLPGQADFICGGPPCQGVSGYNRFRNQKAPLEDVKNKQLIVYMDIIDFLKPKYVLMENVVDILKFAGGFLGRYAVGRLVSMNYQTRMGMMAAGSFGLPQFRMRVFLWGALPNQNLPAYPLPTHEVVSRAVIPTEFEEITVAYAANENCKLANAVYLKDAIKDLPAVNNDESQDERNYGTTPITDFQKYIRAPSGKLYDHLPYKLNKDDYERVCKIPKTKGANFRDLPGVIVKGRKVEWDPAVERVLLTSGKPLIPDYAMSFVRGTSTKPFGRLWWDEIVSTVVTRPEPHNQALLHPLQDRVLTIRENARLQGFPDCYQLCGTVKERYIQVGNAVAVPVALALGYTLGLAIQGLSDNKPLMTLPFKYPSCLAQLLAIVKDDDSSL
ncbi:unnamed protein product [Trifolium pratense]|uniref:Uncharacterized protein n=1 Tax=Trifolium pratense TaxID=57577 RepID=A0ACB0M5X1_TRIPR|nr:unnamed protein product [Trifolium pratense]